MHGVQGVHCSKGMMQLPKQLTWLMYGNLRLAVEAAMGIDVAETCMACEGEQPTHAMPDDMGLFRCTGLSFGVLQ